MDKKYEWTETFDITVNFEEIYNRQKEDAANGYDATDEYIVFDYLDYTCYTVPNDIYERILKDFKRWKKERGL